jgi:protein-L-isoaspartate(D-aspartate) O-methyltransferase
MFERTKERRAMVKEQIHRRGIRAPDVLNALRQVPRHAFVPDDRRTEAYEDHPVPIGEKQTVSQPYIVAKMTELLDLKGNERVLEIGTGSGYQTAILAECARVVYTVERLPLLGARARMTLTALGYENIHERVGDGSRGWPEEAPFDGIIVTAATPEVPLALTDQLAEGGILVLPIGDRVSQMLVTVHREHGRLSRTEHLRCTFVPLLGKEGFAD